MSVLMVLFIGSLVVAVYDHYYPLAHFKGDKIAAKIETSIPEFFDYGVLIDSTYCNDFFRFRINITKGHKGDYKIYDYKSVSILERDSASAKRKRVSEIKEHDLLVIRPVLRKVAVQNLLDKTASAKELLDYIDNKGKYDFYGPDYHLVIRATKLNNLSLNAYASQFSNIHPTNYGNSRTKTISGKEFLELDGMQTQPSVESSVAFRLLGGENKNIKSYMLEMNDFALSIHLFYHTKEQEKILLELLQSLSFH